GDIVKATTDADANVRSVAALCLRAANPADEVVSALAHAVSDPELDVRQAALMALTEIGPPAKAALPALVNAMKDSNAEIRAQAAQAIGAVGGPAPPTAPARGAPVRRGVPGEGDIRY